MALSVPWQWLARSCSPSWTQNPPYDCQPMESQRKRACLSYYQTRRAAVNRQLSTKNGTQNGATQHPPQLPRVATAAGVHELPSTMPLGQFLFEYLHRCGVRHSFDIPGDFALPTFAWLEKSRIRNVTMTHEPACQRICQSSTVSRRGRRTQRSQCHRRRLCGEIAGRCHQRRARAQRPRERPAPPSQSEDV